jgi:hypothetical protein
MYFLFVDICVGVVEHGGNVRKLPPYYLSVTAAHTCTSGTLLYYCLYSCL